MAPHVMRPSKKRFDPQLKKNEKWSVIHERPPMILWCKYKLKKPFLLGCKRFDPQLKKNEKWFVIHERPPMILWYKCKLKKPFLLGRNKISILSVFTGIIFFCICMIAFFCLFWRYFVTAANYFLWHTKRFHFADRFDK